MLIVVANCSKNECAYREAKRTSKKVVRTAEVGLRVRQQHVPREANPGRASDGRGPQKGNAKCRGLRGRLYGWRQRFCPGLWRHR